MKKSNLILIALVVAAAGFFLWALNRPTSGPAAASPAGNGATTTAATSTALEAKTNSDGWAEVEAVPLTLGSNEWSFGIALNAHQEIDADLTKVVTLADDRGDTLSPLRWEEPNPGGHHRKGTLVFKAPASAPASITLAMKDVGGAALRTFTWTLNR